MVGCTPSPEMSRPSSFSSKAPQTVVQAAELHAQALEAVRQGRLSEALTLTEQAVELEPRDVGYRMVLADLYLKNGRFRSAATSFKAVLTLNPRNERAPLTLALTQLALGHSSQATAQLDTLTTTATPGNIGLPPPPPAQPPPP